MHVELTRLDLPDQDDRPIEVVERKGRGHPDTLCDAAAEAFSAALTRHYVDRFGFPLHHNVDKALLVAGSATPAFGGGRVDTPMELILAGRATLEYQGGRVPVEELAEDAARETLGRRVHALDAQRHVRIDTRVRPGSTELVGLFGREGPAARANDSSVGVGFAPLSRLERAVLAAERILTDPDTVRTHPYLGEDVKVLGIRKGHVIDLIVAVAAVGQHLPDLAAYQDAVREAAALVEGAAAAAAGERVRVRVNQADDPESGQIYLTVTGTSAESGDDGQAGRGNRVGGLITPHRPMVMESAAGKNARSHPGKVYGVIAQRIARSLTEQLPVIRRAECLLASRIGAPIDEPLMVEVSIGGAHDTAPGALQTAVELVVHEELERAGDVWKALLEESYELF